MSNEVKTKEKVNMDPKYIITLTVTLLITCVVVAGLLGGVNAFWPQFLGTLVQAVGSGAVFTVLALALDRAGGKARLAPHSQG